MLGYLLGYSFNIIQFFDHVVVDQLCVYIPGPAGSVRSSSSIHSSGYTPDTCSNLNPAWINEMLKITSYSPEHMEIY